jgi:Domain of unknown function (DUF6484)
MKNVVLVEDATSAAQSRPARKPDWGARRDTAESYGALKIAGVLIGRFVGLDESGDPLVDYPENTSARALPARSTLPVDQTALGREVVLMFEGGDPLRPIVMGLVTDRGAKRREPVELVLDKKKLVFTAEQEIVLRCGKSSITLTRAGKVLIRGAYILNRSSGVNRIKGASVQIN